MSGLLYTKDHEYVRVDGDAAVVGVSDYAQAQLGDIVFVDLPKVGKKVAKGAELAVIESVKAASEVYSPVSGEVIEVNSALGERPALVNEEPLAGGWLVRLRVANTEEVEKLMDEAAYAGFVKTL
jgi:glycine cleavage system H protein